MNEKTVSWAPNPLFFGGGFLKDMNVILGVFPVIFTALVCHYNLLHIKNDLPPRYHNKMPKIVRLAGALCITLYILAASFGYALFKDNVQADVLLNYNCKSLESVVGPHACVVVGVLVRSMYAVTLVSYLIDCIALQCFESNLKSLQQQQDPSRSFCLSILNKCLPKSLFVCLFD